jgi:hypothetical protein
VLPVLLNAAATCVLAGLSWVVQVVVYPSFGLVGPTPQWSAFHRAHSRRIAAVVGPPWAVQGVTTAWLMARGDDLLLVAPLAALAAATVALTVLGAVPAHTRLAVYDDAALASLRRLHAWRTAAWSTGAVLSLGLVARLA